MHRVFRLPLLPISWIFGRCVALRNYLYDSGMFRVTGVRIPVISVGNITVGGSGKSPFVSYLAEKLLAVGYRPVILSRGYGGSAVSPHVVGPGDEAELVGDEPLMHFKHLSGKVPVVVSRRRVAGAKLVESLNLGDVILLDDGFQHRALSRSVDLLVIDLSSKKKIAEWKAQKLLPSGVFREPVSALKRASICVIIDRGSRRPSEELESAKVIVEQSVKPIVHFVLLAARWRDLVSNDILGLSALRGRRGVAVAGLASPDSFFDMLDELEVDLCSKWKFADHHPYSAKDWELLTKDGLPLFTTAKDGVKLSQYCSQAGRVYILELEGNFSTDDASDRFFRHVACDSGLSRLTPSGDRAVRDR